MKPRLPSLPVPELTRISYGEGFVAKRLQILKKAGEIVLNNSMQAGDKYKAAHDVKATQHGLKEGDFAYLDNQLFLGKNKKFAQRWIANFPKKKTSSLSLQTKEIH